MDEAVLRGSALQPGHYDSYLESEGVRTLRVLVADDQTLFRAGFRRLLAELLPGAVVTEVSNAAEAWKTLNREEDFDLLLLDLSTPGIQEGPGVKRFVEKCPGTPVVVLATRVHPDDIARCMDFGARGVVPKSVSESVLQHALALVLAGEIYVPRIAIRRVLTKSPVSRSDGLDGLPEDNPLRQLTPRQLSTLSLIVGGSSNKEIARSLNLLESTVKAHVKAILRKLSASNRTQAALIAADLGWPRPSRLSAQ